MSRCTPTLLPSAAPSSACLLPSRQPAAWRSRRSSCSCKATVGDGLVDRRDVLLGLTGLAASSNLGMAVAAGSVPATTVLKCDGTGLGPLACPTEYNPAEVIDFSELKKTTTGTRVRRAAHRLNADEVRRFEKAIRRMKELPDSDPRSFRRQLAIHEAYCGKHYKMVGADGSMTPLNVHFSSIFAPWHRIYIYFFERILGELAEDHTFALPYWNWDEKEGMTIPSIFMNERSPLYHSVREQERVRGMIDLNFDPKANQEVECFNGPSCSQLIQNNLTLMYRDMMEGKNSDYFHGSSFYGFAPASGSLEAGGHTGAHRWVGGDMGKLSTAARDPVFYSNHSNADRLWHLWSTELGGIDPTYDEKWLDTTFVFYDEKKRPVRISIKDVLKLEDLGYTYEKKGREEWRSKAPLPANLNRTKPSAAPIRKKRSIDIGPIFPITLKKGEKQYVTVKRPEKKASPTEQEVLVVDMTIDPCEYANFSVLVNVPRGQEDKVEPSNSEYVGRYMQVPHGGPSTMTMQPFEVSHRFSVGELIQDLNAGGDKTLDVTLIPVDGSKTQIRGMHVEVLRQLS